MFDKMKTLVMSLKSPQLVAFTYVWLMMSGSGIAALGIHEGNAFATVIGMSLVLAAFAVDVSACSE